MKTYKNIYQKLCTKENLELAFKKAQKRKSLKPYVIEFRADLNKNLEQLRQELISETYQPKPLRTFIVREPKTRKIRKSYFVDRIVHHAICNVIEPIFEKRFIYDSFANRKRKGSLKALDRFDNFKRKVSKNNTGKCYVLKADVKHYFDEVNHNVLINILRKKIADEKLICLIWKVLNNHSKDVGMPLGNMTSQFFANVYLNELDQFVKHKLKAQYYIRYVDDFVILHNNRQTLESYKMSIDYFLKDKLNLELHPTKCKIMLLKKGVSFLGFRNFFYHRLLRRANILNMRRQLAMKNTSLLEYLQGWLSYAIHGNTFTLRKRIEHFVKNSLGDKA